jgi:hypothetical protein
MTHSLAKAIELASSLPEADQEALGALMLEELKSEERWTILFESSQDQLARLADQALEEHRSGKTITWE